MKFKTLFSNLFTDIGLALGLLTVLPWPFFPAAPDHSPGRAVGYFPLVGLMMGALLAGSGQLLALFLPNGVAAALLLALWAGLTGLLHLDGFMDSCDGLLPPRNQARRLEIMKDSRAGAFGVVGVILLLLLKFNALAALPDRYQVSALATVPVLARWAMSWTMARYPLARSEGLSVFFSTGLGWTQVGLASTVAITVSLVLMGWSGVLLLGIAWLTATLIARLALARISGLTGDVYGAICEATETVLLVAVLLTG